MRRRLAIGAVLAVGLAAVAAGGGASTAQGAEAE